MAFPEFQTKEVLNKVLNSGGDALKVDIDNVTLKTEGSDITIEVHTDKAEDSMLVFSNTTKDGSGTSYVPVVDSDGHLQLDVLTSALPSGAATASNQSTIIGHVDGIETLIGSTNTKLDTLEATADALETLLTGIDADTNAIKIDADAIETLITSTNSKLDTLETTANAQETLLTGIDADTNNIKTAVELLDNAVDGNYLNVNANIAGTDFVGGAGAVASGVQRVTLASDDPAVSSLNKMLYGNALVITAVDGGSTQDLSGTYEALYVGTGGDVVVTMVGTGNFTFKNVASGQLLPIRFTHVINTNTTATNMIALKA